MQAVANKKAEKNTECGPEHGTKIKTNVCIFWPSFVQAKYIGFRLKQKKQNGGRINDENFVIQRVNHAEVKSRWRNSWKKLEKGFLVLIGVGRGGYQGRCRLVFEKTSGTSYF